MQNHYEALEKQYRIHETIGSGGFAKVKLATHLLTDDKVAIKIMDKKALGDDLPRVEMEIRALKELGHQNICRLYQVIEDDSRIYLVLEYCSGGELFDYIVKKDRLPEPEARHFFRQIIAAVAFTHHKGYAHRDLKPENLLLTTELQLKLIDFGLCASPVKNKSLETCCGSPAYAAPELIAGNAYFGNEADIWSMGVLLYALLCGFLPFEDECLPKMYQKIQKGKYVEPHWLSESSCSILQAMLQPVPKKRITIDQLLCHPWVVKEYSQPLKYQSIYNGEIDRECVIELSNHLGFTFDDTVERIGEWKYDYLTVTYFLLFNRKRKGLPVLLPSTAKSYAAAIALNNQNAASILRSPTFHASLDNDLNKFDYNDFVDDLNRRDYVKHSYRKAVAGAGNAFLNVENITTPYMQKIRRRSTKKDSVLVKSAKKKENENDEENKENVLPTTPITNKHQMMNNGWKADAFMTPQIRKNILPCIMQENEDFCDKTPERMEIHGSRFVAPESTSDEDLQKNGLYERKPRDSASKSTNKFSRRVFNSVERKVDKVISMLTPKKFRDTPIKIREANTSTVNVSTTSSKNPEHVLDELLKVFEAKGITCKQKGWTVRGVAKDANGNKSLTLEFEVVRIERLDMIGVKRKRLNGDSFMYKRICEDVLNLASL